MSYLPEKSWPGVEVDKPRRPGSHVRVFFTSGTGEPTQVAEIALDASYVGFLMVEVNDQIVFTNAESKAAGVENTVEVKSTDGK